MNRHQPAAVVDAVERIWARVTGNSAAVGDLFERIIQSFYSKLIQPGDVVIDGGAHLGRHTIPLARLVGPDGLVLAFEPLPAPSQTLQQLLASADLSSRVRLGAEALARAGGRSEFFVVHNMLEYSGLRSRQYVNFQPDQSAIQVEVTTIDSVLSASAHGGTLSFIKLDLESGEFRALQGAEAALRTHAPCCVFENGLQSSADGYDAAEFFAYFDGIDYELYDILGSPVTESCWAHPGPWYFVAIPRRRRDLLPMLWTSALEELLAFGWRMPMPPGAPPATFERRRGWTAASGSTGHLDHVDASIRLSGWAANFRTGLPARSLVVAVDGVPIATARTDIPRHDVVTATGRAGFERSGFSVTVGVAGGQRVEVLAEERDGTFATLGGPVVVTGPPGRRRAARFRSSLRAAMARWSARAQR